MSKKKRILSSGKWYKIKAAADANSAEVLIYGDIGESWWGDTVTARDMVKELNELDVESLTVRINSYGGSVTDGIAIYNAIKRHQAEVTVVVDGIAASVASLIAMAGDTVEMPANAQMMIHAPWGGASGNAKDMRDMADVLDSFAESMATSYMAKSGKGHEEIIALLTDGVDHWYSAADAEAMGFADQITDEVKIAAKFNLASRFENLPAAAAAFNRKEKSMSKKIKPAASVAAVTVDPANPGTDTQTPEEIKAQVLAAETERRGAVRAVFAPFVQQEGVQAVLDHCLDDIRIDAAAASERLLAKLGEGAEPVAAATRVEVGESAQEKFRAGAALALAVRAGMAKDADQTGNQYRGYSLMEMARASLEQNGVRTGHMGKMDLVAAAFTHSTGDFGNILIDSAEKAMLRGYDEAEETFQAWTNRGVLGDFKVNNRVDLNSFPSLAEVPEGAEYKYATVGDSKETIQLATYGKLFSITRQAIINDDLDAFTRIPQKMGRAAIRTVGDLVYAILTGNPNMGDGTALFHADHSNLLAGAAISTASVDAMRVAMARQKDGGSNAHALNIRLANLIVPMALEGTAKVVAESQFEVGGTASTKANTVPNSVRGTFEVISDARLDASSASNWFGAASAGMHDTVEVAYLDGNEAPYLEQQNGFNVDGVQFKVRMDAGVKALDFRTMAKNPN